MIDRILLKFFGSIDNLLEWIRAPRCKCKKKRDER